MYYFSIPDSDMVRPINSILLTMLEQKKHWFYDDFVIDVAYGCPPSCIWNGNRGCDDIIYYPKKWNQIIEMYKHFNISYRVLFTNFLLRPEHLHDTYANKVAEILNNYGGYVMVSRPLMAFYVKNYFPNLKIGWSTTTDFGSTREEQIAKINELSAEGLVVPPLDFKGYIAMDEFQHPENIEIIVNEQCRDNCPRRKEHWTDVNECIIMEHDQSRPVGCFFPEQYGKGKRNHNISREELGECAVKGINHFKISGRIDTVQTVQAYLEYFVLPQYRMEFGVLMEKYGDLKNY